jgi:L-fuculose-phosphate aldolase
MPSPRGHEGAERDARRQIVEVCRRIYARGWITATDGNVSILLDEGRVLATPTGVNKGTLAEDDLIVVDRSGAKIAGARQPSSELRMHLAAYDERPDVRAVVHAHPTNCIAFSLAGVSLAQCLLPEIVFTFGSIPTTAYTAPTTDEVPREIKKWLRDFDAMILDRHGSLTVGADVLAAYDKLERMEHVAEITFRARMLGPIRPLTPAQVEQLRQVGRGLGLPERKILPAPCSFCNACSASTMKEAHIVGAPPREAPDVEDLVRRVSESVTKAIGRRG